MSLNATTHVILTDSATYDFYGLRKLEVDGYALHSFGMTTATKLAHTDLSQVILGDLSVMLQFRLSTGDVVECSADQEFYMTSWEWKRADQIKVLDRPLIQFGGDVQIEYVGVLNGTYQVGSVSSELGNYILASGLLVKNI